MYNFGALDTDFKPKVEEKISLIKQLLELLRNTPFPHSARLPKEYSFQ
jgi:hypothetical protein